MKYGCGVTRKIDKVRKAALKMDENQQIAILESQLATSQERECALREFKDGLEHWVYHALVPLFERYLKLEPCPAIKLAGEESGKFAALMLHVARAHQETDQEALTTVKPND